MTMDDRTDALRQTLDRLQLDASVKEDRQYLISMLRRLGYTEEEIEQELGPDPFDPVVPPAPEPVEVMEDDTSGPRVVEVEYVGGRSISEFEPVFRSAREAPKEDLLEFRPYTPKRIRMKIVHAEDRDEAERLARDQGLEVMRAFPVGVRRGDAPEAPTRSWDASEAVTAPAADDWAPVEEWEESGEWETPQPERLAEGTIDPVDDWTPAPAVAPAAVAAEPEGFEGPSDDMDWDEPAAPPTPAAPIGEPFIHGDYTLYARDVELATGNNQRIYFFARGRPSAGNPSPLPEGYVVRENEKTGLPFLARDRGA